MISSTFLNKLASFIESKVDKVDYILDGSNKTSTINSRETTNNTVKISIILDENVKGTITKFKIIDTDGDIIKTEDCNILKSHGRGLYRSFTLSVSEVI